jgi:hypothetical protein
MAVEAIDRGEGDLGIGQAQAYERGPGGLRDGLSRLRQQRLRFSTSASASACGSPRS